MSGCQSVGATTRAASEGQMEASRGRASSSVRIACSNAAMGASARPRRQASLQLRKESQVRAHALRHVIVRPQRAQTFTLVRRLPAPSRAAHGGRVPHRRHEDSGTLHR